MCGEQAREFSAGGILVGSPPRVRGTGVLITIAGGEARITPACAGNSLTSSVLPAPCRDHPRVCGEQLGRQGQPGIILGSPPRVRGTVDRAVLVRLEKGITPACAGNS